jgi:large subunit ribosomal protein LX
LNGNQTVQVFRISGIFRQRREVSEFSKEFCALTEEQAKEQLYTQLGSKNRLKRRQIRIDSISIISREEVTDPLIQKILDTEFNIPFEEN